MPRVSKPRSAPQRAKDSHRLQECEECGNWYQGSRTEHLKGVGCTALANKKAAYRNGEAPAGEVYMALMAAVIPLTRRFTSIVGERRRGKTVRVLRMEFWGPEWAVRAAEKGATEAQLRALKQEHERSKTNG